ncbi:MAG: hypothetical protein IPL46_02370 [Saprospiraceae bacterium]|nr:hypothetical protein [Saprospiraceae bacterium]
MLKLKAFDLSISGIVYRFYLMMALAAIFGFLSQWTLAAALAFTVAVSFIIGLSVHMVKPEKVAVNKKFESKLRSLEKEEVIRQNVA